MSIYWHGFGHRKRMDAWHDFHVVDGCTMYDGDQFRLVLIPSHDCYVYVVNVDPSGTASLLYPLAGNDNYLLAGKHQEVPQGIDWFTLDDQVGQEMIFLVASYDPLEFLQRMTDHDWQSASVKREGDAALALLGELKTNPNDELITRSGVRIDTRGIKIKPDRRVAAVKHPVSGVTMSSDMSFVQGSVDVVEAISFDHKRLPRLE